MASSKKCVLAFSGGLDTSAIVPWLIDQGYEVHALLVDVGQGEDLEAVCNKACQLGAKSVECVDVKPAICDNVLKYAIALGAKYEGQYLLGTAFTRPYIAWEQVKLAKKLGGATLVHGATGKGNDQIRFEFAYKSLAADIPVLSPWKVWSFSGRQDLVDFLQSKGISDCKVKSQYSLDENLWHLSIEGGALEDPFTRLDVEKVLKDVQNLFASGTNQITAPESVTVDFDQGSPVAAEGISMPLINLVSHLNLLYRDASWGWDLVIENRFTGVKSRGVYINPAGKLLYCAVDALARSCLSKPLYDLYLKLGEHYANLLYRGEYFSSQRLVLESAARVVMQHLNGTVTVQLIPKPHVSQIRSNNAIFTEKLATFEKSDFSHQDAQGYIELSWLKNIGEPFIGEGYADALETGCDASPGLYQDQSMSRRGLVSTTI